MRDREIVALLVSGDRSDVRRGLEEAYTTYADRLHDYARSMLRTQDPAAAADVLHDTFLIAAAKAPELRDPDRFRSWLYAITRNECLRVLRGHKRHEPLEHDGVPHPALVAADAERSPDMAADLSRQDLRELVHAAAAGLSPKDHEVFDLGMRHDLSAAEIASALRVSENAAHSMLSRVRTHFATALGAMMVALRGRGQCTGLDNLLDGWDGTFDALWRKRIARHVETCATCTATQERELSPASLLGLAPLLGAPAIVRSRLFDDELDLVSAGRALVHRAGPWDRDGFPGEVPSRRRPALVALLGVLLLVGLLLPIAWWVRDTRLQRDSTVVPTTQINSVLLASDPTLPSFVLEPGGTLTPAPSTATSTSATPSPTLLPTATATTSAPPPPTKSSKPTPTTTAPTTPTTAPTPPPTPGTLRVLPTTHTVNPSTGGTCTVTLAASGGPVDWTSTPSVSTLTVSPSSGHLAAGASATVTITVPSAAPATYRVWFNPGAIDVIISPATTAAPSCQQSVP